MTHPDSGEGSATPIASPPRRVGRVDPAPAVDIVIPVHNEEVDLERTVRRLRAHLCTSLPYTFRITIADNASTDRTWQIAQRLAGELSEVAAVHLPLKGRGRALREVWSTSDAAVLAYMDVDLSTDLAAVLPLVAPLISGHSDVAIGTRLNPSSRVVRGPKRELISRGYNLIVRTTLGAGFTDAQCGFKAIRADAAAALLPLVEDPEWFFDTELLVLAEHAGMRIHEVPVDWVDDSTSTVDIVDTARKDLAGIWRLARGMRRGDIPLATLRTPARAESSAGAPAGIVWQLARFGVVGLLSTLAYGLLFWMLRNAMSAMWANMLALLLTAVANTAANRWFTFGVRGRRDRVRHQAQGLLVFLLGLAVTSGSLAALTAVAPNAARWVELAVLTAANVVATLLRFLLLRAWVFAGHRRLHPTVPAPDTIPTPAEKRTGPMPDTTDETPRRSPSNPARDRTSTDFAMEAAR